MVVDIAVCDKKVAKSSDKLKEWGAVERVSIGDEDQVRYGDEQDQATKVSVHTGTLTDGESSVIQRGKPGDGNTVKIVVERLRQCRLLNARPWVRKVSGASLLSLSVTDSCKQK